MISSDPPVSLPELAPGRRVGRLAGALLDRLEEVLIASLIAAATALVFVAVVHRYGTSASIDLAKWLEAHGITLFSPLLRGLFAWLAARDLSWAQELCIYMFIWMAKFGAAYGVRTGIHVGVDVLVLRLEPKRARKVILFGLLCGAVFTATIANFGLHFVQGVWSSGTRSNDLEAPMWIVYLAIPLGSALMCFRFLQVAWHFWRRGELPRHDQAHVDGVEQEEAPVTLSTEAAAASSKPRGRVLGWFLLLLPFALLGLGLLFKHGVVPAPGGARTLLVFALLVSLMLTGMPISIALGLTVLSFMFLLTEVPLDSVAMKLFTGIENFEIMAIPFFILAGNFLTHGGVARRMISFATALVGHWHGGLGLSAVVACALFAAVSGSSPATVVAIGSVLLPAMVKAGYPRRFGAGVVTTSGALGILIPPSIAMVLYAVSTNTSVGKLFIAGIVPGMLLATMLGLMTWYRARRGDYPRMAREPWNRKLRAGRDSIWGLLLIVIVIGGIYTGLFTPTEAAAVSAVYAFIVAVFVYRDLRLSEVPRVLLASANTSAMLLYIITNAVLFSFLMTSEQIPQAMAGWMVERGFGAVGFLLLVNLILLAAGNVMEPSSIILIMAPILFPVAMKLGIDPIHFGILITVNMEVGLCHPPVGLNLYVASGIARMGITELTIAVWPWLVTMLVFLVLVTYVPEISLVLPRLLGM
ncbi:TRAP transporter large permease subunit [Ramlibacter sp. G-1-2-2]|uniref:TRAP transporter large permease subunit n=1 Tax=Ramlibacter agri TaxID=2728837 RepID=A0A848H9M8_9BURK|nr:TRAP transporter large permease subunit [Ramlibacter agri]